MILLKHKDCVGRKEYVVGGYRHCYTYPTWFKWSIPLGFNEVVDKLEVFYKKFVQPGGMLDHAKWGSSFLDMIRLQSRVRPKIEYKIAHQSLSELNRCRKDLC